MTDAPMPCELERLSGNVAYLVRHAPVPKLNTAPPPLDGAELHRWAGTVAEDARTRPRNTHMTHGQKIMQLRQLAAEGKTQFQIAAALGLKPETVRVYASANQIKLRRLTAPARSNWDWEAEMPRLRANVRAAVLAEIGDGGSAGERRQ